jgi:hypothetical protein
MTFKGFSYIAGFSAVLLRVSRWSLPSQDGWPLPSPCGTPHRSARPSLARTLPGQRPAGPLGNWSGLGPEDVRTALMACGGQGALIGRLAWLPTSSTSHPSGLSHLKWKSPRRPSSAELWGSWTPASGSVDLWITRTRLLSRRLEPRLGSVLSPAGSLVWPRARRCGYCADGLWCSNLCLRKI